MAACHSSAAASRQLGTRRLGVRLGQLAPSHERGYDLTALQNDPPFEVTRLTHRASASSSIQPFHLAFPVHSIAEARDFYGRMLGCPEGRSAETWVDYNLFGHQIVCHHVAGYHAASSANAVDGDAVPVPHFGLALDKEAFHALADRVKQAGIHFEIEPHLRFKGAPGEQYTMFFKDPSGNALEFKAMTNPDNLFAKYVVQ